MTRLVFLAGMACLLSNAGWSQSAPAFEVASIRRNPGVSPNTQINTSGGRLTVTNGSVKTLIRNAYGILAFQLAGEPRWLDNEMYDIVASTGRPGQISPEEFKLLLQSLLADRFGLKVHWETRETSVYALLVVAGGPRFHQSEATGEPGINTRKGPGAARMIGTREPISILASNLGNQLGHFVLDQTGLTGAYDWKLDWDPDPNADSTLPSLLTALQEQLGLKLEAQKGPMETLVIDSVERPSLN